jgi:hypothetical protein
VRPGSPTLRGRDIVTSRAPMVVVVEAPTHG